MFIKHLHQQNYLSPEPRNQRTSLSQPVADLTNTDDHSIRGSGDRINPRTEAPVPNRIIPTLFSFPALIIGNTVVRIFL